MAANYRPSTSSSSPSLPGPSSSTSRDQPAGQSRNGRKRKREDTDRPQGETKRSRVTWDETTKGCSRAYRNMKKLISQRQYWEALVYTRTHVSSVSIRAKLQRLLQKAMIHIIDVRGGNYKGRGQDYVNIMMYLLSERLDSEDYNVHDDSTFRAFFWEYLKPNYTETLMNLVNRYAKKKENKRRMWRMMFRDIEHRISCTLQVIREKIQADEPEYLQERQKTLAHFVQMLPATVHDNSATTITEDFSPMFARAVGLRLVPEAKLIYEAGAVNNAELTAVANNSGIQKKLSNEEDQSEMAVFLRKVLKQPRSLESMALLRVSRLVGQEDVLGREDRVRQLPLPSKLRDAVLLRPVFNRYRKEIECKDQS